MEVETLVLIAQRRKYVPDKDANELLGKTSEIGKMLTGLTKSLR